MIKNKTIFIAHNWSDTSVSQQSKALALELSHSNKVIFMSAKKNGFNGKQISANLIIYDWPGSRPTGVRDFIFAVKLFKKFKPDIAITNFAANNIMLLVSWLAGTNVRMCYHHTLVEQILTDINKVALSTKQRFFIARKALIYKLATHMLPCSSAAKEDLIKYYKVSHAKAFVFPNALQDRNLKNIGADSKTIGFIGRLDYSKGVDILIAAFQQIVSHYPDVKLVIVGTGKQRKALEMQALQYSGNSIFTGGVSYDNVFKYLQTFTCLVVPSRTDNLPTVILEAFSCGTPVIASNAGGIPDIIEDGENGLLFNDENPIELANKMTLLLTNKEEGSRLAENARQTFLEKFCIDTLPLRFEQLLTTTHYL